MITHNKRILKAFSTNQNYFEMMERHHFGRGGIAVEPEMKRLIAENCKGNVLDAGCGEGSITTWFAEYHLEGSFFGLDVSPIGIEKANARHSTAAFIVGNLCELPFDDNSFDFIYSQSVLEHVPNYERSLDEFYRVLKLKGKLLIRVGNGGREDRSLKHAFFAYLFRVNKNKVLSPSLLLRENNKQDHRTNFDVTLIPSDVLLKQLTKRGFLIKYFTTRRSRIARDTQAFGKANATKRSLYNFLMELPFFPFTHLGPTIIVMVMKA